MSLPVLFDTVKTPNGLYIGLATLNKPEALNAVDLEMVNLLLVQLTDWQDRDDIAMVMIDSRGDKAFCAGGDVVSMHQAMHQASGGRDKGHQESVDAIPEMLKSFFSQEYRLDYLIHTFSKPILVWGNGIIMGGGLGLMAGASHRIVTQTARIAMPEVSIGLFPDVGGSWFLNRMPSGCGRFLGTTGASIDSIDALYLNLADHLIEHASKTQVIEALKSLDWDSCSAQNAAQVTQVIEQFEITNRPTGNVEKHQNLIDQLDKQSSVSDYIKAISTMDVQNDKWLSKAQASVHYGSSITLHLVHQQLKRAESLSLTECFKMELIMACRCATYGEFEEGVRALLIDKDKSPDWAFKTVEDVESTVIDAFFTSPWQSNDFPLASLGQ